MATGTVLIAISYAMSRAGTGSPSIVYWLGMLAIFGPPTALAVWRRLNDQDLWAATLTLALATALVKCMYSPLRLEFPDELQHLRGLVDLLGTGHYGAQNPALPTATDYPGLETVAAALARITGLRLDVLAIVIGAALHVTNSLLVAYCLRVMTRSPRAALVAVLVYACNASFIFFNSLFVYENLALTFSLIAIACLITPTRTRRQLLPRFLGAVAASFATIVTHHLTAGFEIASLFLLYPYLRARRSVTAARLALLAGIVATVAATAWVTLVARSTLAYLDPAPSARLPVRLQQGRYLVLASGPPTWEFVLAGAGLTFLFAASVGTVVMALRRRARGWLAIGCFSVLALGATELIRLASSRGSEIAGRSSPFLYVGVALAVTYFCLEVASGNHARRRWLAIGGICLAFLGGVCASWPIWWDRLPGDRLVATTFERGVDEQEIAAADWIRRNLPGDARIAGDNNALVEIASRGRRTGVANAAQVFYSSRITREVTTTLRKLSIGWLWVNTRLPDTPSPDGLYFGDEGFNGRRAPTRAALVKFAGDPRFECVYDNGEIRLFHYLPAAG